MFTLEIYNTKDSRNTILMINIRRQYNCTDDLHTIVNGQKKTYVFS
jgi:hypothetical protein